jgi:pyrroline-5-carboxylate reductase
MVPLWKLMSNKKHIVFIGLGSMGSALLKGFDRSQNLLMAYTPSGLKEDKRALVDNEIKDLSELKGLLKKDSILVLAMKPQQLLSFYQELKNKCDALDFLNEVTLVSLLAGVRLEGLKKLFPVSPLVRVMPNTPALIGEGLHLITVEKEASKKDIQTLFASSGDVHFVTEDDLDFIMPVTASGPGIIFRLFEIWLKSMPAHLDKDIARQMILKTFLGSTKLAESENNLSFSELCKQVTSYKGVTERALTTLATGNIEGLFTQAMNEARIRNDELNNDFKKNLDSQI